MGRLRDHLVEPMQRILDVAFDGQLHLSVLVQLGRIHVDVDDGSVLTELLHLAGHAIIEAHAKGEQ